MKRFSFIFLPAILLLAGCKPDEPSVAATPPQSQQGGTYVEWADNPFWGPISDCLAGNGIQDVWNTPDFSNGGGYVPEGITDDDPGFQELVGKMIFQDMDDIVLEDVTSKLNKLVGVLDKIGYFEIGVSLALLVADKVARFGEKASKEADKLILEMVQSRAEIQIISAQQKAIQENLTKRILLMCQTINDQCKQEIIKRNEIERINQLYAYINECHNRAYHNITFAQPYWDELLKINERYAVADETQIISEETKRSYYREVYALLSEWALPDYANVFEAVNFAQYLHSQQGGNGKFSQVGEGGMSLIYYEWVLKACLWNFERKRIFAQLAMQDISAMIYSGCLATDYIHACRYLKIGMDERVCADVEKQLNEHFVISEDEYLAVWKNLYKNNTRQCFIPGAEFASADSLLTVIPYNSSKWWAKGSTYSPEKVVYGYATSSAAEQKSIISDSIANQILDFYGNQLTLCYILLSEGGFSVPEEYMHTTIGDVEILTSGVLKDNISEDGNYASIYVSGAFNREQRSDKHLTRWMGTVKIENNIISGWSEFAKPSVWMTLHSNTK